MTEYDPTFTFPIVFPNEPATGYIAEVLAAHGLTNLRLAETEKYAHVTYFFNGGREAPYAGEERVLVPSPKVPTYDLQPEMTRGRHHRRAGRRTWRRRSTTSSSATSRTRTWWATPAASKRRSRRSRRSTDVSAASITAILAAGGTAIVTADHGNAEQMWDYTHERAAHRTHHEPGAGHPGGWSWDRQSAAARDRCALRHRTDDAGAAGTGTVEGDDGERPAEGIGDNPITCTYRRTRTYEGSCRSSAS